MADVAAARRAARCRRRAMSMGMMSSARPLRGVVQRRDVCATLALYGKRGRIGGSCRALSTEGFSEQMVVRRELREEERGGYRETRGVPGDFDITSRRANLGEEAEWHAFIEGLAWFANEFGHSYITPRYSIPEDEGHALGGAPLGSWVLLVRRKRREYVDRHPGRLEQLEDVGFIWDPETYFFYEILLPGLEWYKEEHGDLLVPCKVVIPAVDHVPPQCHDLKLGKFCAIFRSPKLNKKPRWLGGHPDRREELNKLDFPWDKKDYAFWNKTFPALCWFKEQYGHLLINTRFVVPDEPDIPQMIRKYRLGPCVNKIRVRGDYVRDSAERREALDSIGFIWRAADADESFLLMQQDTGDEDVKEEDI